MMQLLLLLLMVMMVLGVRANKPDEGGDGH